MEIQKPPSPGAARHPLLRCKCSLVPKGEGLFPSPSGESAARGAEPVRGEGRC